MPTSPPSRAELQRAVDAANAAIRRFVATVPGGRLNGTDRVVYDGLVDAYLGAVRARDARGCEGEDEPARAA